MCNQYYQKKLHKGRLYRRDYFVSFAHLIENNTGKLQKNRGRKRRTLQISNAVNKQIIFYAQKQGIHSPK